MKAGRMTWNISRAACAAILCALTAGPQAVVAGEPPTAKIMVNPVPAKVGPPYPPLIGGGPNIVGNELRLDAGGVRVWVEVQLQDWDPNGDGSPGVFEFEVALDGSGLLDADIDGDGDVSDDGDQEDILLARVPYQSCVADCLAAFGEFASGICSPSLICNPVYSDTNGFVRQDGWCAGAQCGGIDAFETDFGWIAALIYNADFRPDDGTVRWGGTAVYDVPPGAKGKYTAALLTDQTRLRTLVGGPPPQEVPTLTETGFVINILTGRCCFGYGMPFEGCVEGVTRAECGDEPPPVAFTPGAHCPPDGTACGEDFGACCDSLHGTCEGPVELLECQGEHSIWTANLSCADADCVADTGACCDHNPFVPCTDNTALSDCECPTCTWRKLQTCDAIDCPPGNPIPTASGWGLAVLTLLLMIGAKIAFGGRADVSRATWH